MQHVATSSWQSNTRITLQSVCHSLHYFVTCFDFLAFQTTIVIRGEKNKNTERVTRDLWQRIITRHLCPDLHPAYHIVLFFIFLRLELKGGDVPPCLLLSHHSLIFKLSKAIMSGLWICQAVFKVIRPLLANKRWVLIFLSIALTSTLFWLFWNKQSLHSTGRHCFVVTPLYVNMTVLRIMATS